MMELKIFIPAMMVYFGLAAFFFGRLYDKKNVYDKRLFRLTYILALMAGCSLWGLFVIFLLIGALGKGIIKGLGAGGDK